MSGFRTDHLTVLVDNEFLQAAQINPHEDEVDLLASVTFQLKKEVFNAMHYAIDKVAGNLDILFPDPSQGSVRKKLTMQT